MDKELTTENSIFIFELKMDKDRGVETVVEKALSLDNHGKKAALQCEVPSFLYS